MYCMDYSIRFFHFFNNGSYPDNWYNFSYFNMGASKEGYAEVKLEIIVFEKL
jgi:hypothetical protein